MMMLRNGFVMGRTTDSLDHFHNLRLDVDSMSYEVCFSKHIDLTLAQKIKYSSVGSCFILFNI